VTQEKNRSLVDASLTDKVTDNGDVDENPQLTLAALASMDNHGAREQIESLVEPLIEFQTDCFCKRFCGCNHLKYQCSLANPVISPVIRDPSTATVKNKRVCEWGSASHHWMFDYLINKQRLLKFTNRHGDSLYDYFFQIINSLAFFQRWKNWRFSAAGIPLPIKNMGPAAVSVFRGLQQQRKLSFIAEQADLKLSDVELLAEEIILHLSDTNTYSDLQLSNPPVTSKPRSKILEQNESEIAASINQDSDAVTENEDLNTLWSELSITEQFVIEAIVINQQAEDTILYALRIMNIRLKEGVLPEDTTVEMLHDFKSNSLIKLAHNIYWHI